jgi:hypothetical protein
MPALLSRGHPTRYPLKFSRREIAVDFRRGFRVRRRRAEETRLAIY